MFCCSQVILPVRSSQPQPRHACSESSTDLQYVYLTTACLLDNCYMYMYVCMYACMYVCMYACMHACMHVCMCVYIYIYIYTYVYIYIYRYIYICITSRPQHSVGFGVKTRSVDLQTSHEEEVPRRICIQHSILCCIHI